MTDFFLKGGGVVVIEVGVDHFFCGFECFFDVFVDQSLSDGQTDVVSAFFAHGFG